MNLDQEIELTLSKLLQGDGDPAAVLRAFAARVQEGCKVVERIETVHACKSCETPDAECFQCKAKSMLGEKAFMAAPLVIPQLASMVKRWAAEAREKNLKRKKAKQEAAKQSRHTDSFPGPQSF
jgi:hypothetical protein